MDPTLLKAITFFCMMLPAATLAEDQRDLSILVSEARKNDVVLLGEEHQNPKHAKTFIQLLDKLEREHPGLIGAVGLEVYGVYQPVITKFMESGDESALIQTPDSEAIRGHRNSSDIKENFLAIYRALHELNRKRSATNKIQVVAIDEKPDPSVTWNEWKKKHSLEALINWGASRDPKMLEALKPVIQKAMASGKLSLVFVGAGHIQKSGTMELKNGISITWLGSRLKKEFSKVLVVNQNDPGNDCVDLIEKGLKGKPSTLLDLRVSNWGKIRSFRCDNELPIQYEFSPKKYAAKDHYDLYWYYPAR